MTRIVQSRGLLARLILARKFLARRLVPALRLDHVERSTGTADDVGQVVEGLDLLGDDAAHGGCRFGRLARDLDETAAQLAARRLQLVMDLARHAPHFLRRRR